MLLGWGAGSLIGGFADADRVDLSETAIGELSGRLPAGTTAILAEVEEYATEVLDGVVSRWAARSCGSRPTRSSASWRPPGRRHRR